MLGHTRTQTHTSMRAHKKAHKHTFSVPFILFLWVFALVYTHFSKPNSLCATVNHAAGLRRAAHRRVLQYFSDTRCHQPQAISFTLRCSGDTQPITTWKPQQRGCWWKEHWFQPGVWSANMRCTEHIPLEILWRWGGEGLNWIHIVCMQVPPVSPNTTTKQAVTRGGSGLVWIMLKRTRYVSLCCCYCKLFYSQSSLKGWRSLSSVRILVYTVLGHLTTQHTQMWKHVSWML